jgi:hypothetical protein
MPVTPALTTFRIFCDAHRGDCFYGSSSRGSGSIRGRVASAAAVSKSSKSKSICAAFWSLRFVEPDRASQFFFGHYFSFVLLGMLVAEPLKDENRVTWSAPLFDPERLV